MVRQLFFKLGVVGALCVSSLYGFGFDNCRSNDCDYLGTGFLIGGYGSLHTFYFHSCDTFRDIGSSTNEKLLFDYDLIQRAGGGGGYIGYGCSFCDRFTISLKVAAMGFGSEAKHSFITPFPSIDDNFTQELKVRYVVDIFAQPGALIGNCLLLYTKLGATYADVKQTVQWADNDPPFPVLNKASTSHDQWGFIFGLGSKVALTRCFSVFAECEWHTYPFSGSSGRLNAQNATPPNIEFLENSRITRLHGMGFNAGLSYEF